MKVKFNFELEKDDAENLLMALKDKAKWFLSKSYQENHKDIKANYLQGLEYWNNIINTVSKGVK